MKLSPVRIDEKPVMNTPSAAVITWLLAAAVLFHFALMQELPATSYLTRADKLMLGVYVSLALGMLSTWWMYLVEERNQGKVFVIARVVVPVLNVVVMTAACVV